MFFCFRKASTAKLKVTMETNQFPEVSSERHLRSGSSFCSRDTNQHSPRVSHRPGAGGPGGGIAVMCPSADSAGEHPAESGQQRLLPHKPFNPINNQQELGDTPLSQQNHFSFQFMCSLLRIAGLESVPKLQPNPIPTQHPLTGGQPSFEGEKCGKIRRDEDNLSPDISCCSSCYGFAHSEVVLPHQHLKLS